MNEPQINGAALRAIRVARGVQRASLARDVGIDPSYLYKIEIGLGNPRRPIIRLLAEGLGVPVDAITRSAHRTAS